MPAELLIHQLSRLYTMAPDADGLGEIADASVAFSGGRLVYVGPSAGAPDAAEVVDGRGLVGMPGDRKSVV